MFSIDQTVRFKSCKVCNPDHLHCNNKNCVIKHFVHSDGYIYGSIKSIKQHKIDIQIINMKDSYEPSWRQNRNSVGMTLAPGVICFLTQPQSKKLKFKQIVKDND